MSPEGDAAARRSTESARSGPRPCAARTRLISRTSLRSRAVPAPAHGATTSAATTTVRATRRIGAGMLARGLREQDAGEDDAAARELPGTERLAEPRPCDHARNDGFEHRDDPYARSRQVAEGGDDEPEGDHRPDHHHEEKQQP